MLNVVVEVSKTKKGKSKDAREEEDNNSTCTFCRWERIDKVNCGRTRERIHWPLLLLLSIASSQALAMADRIYHIARAYHPV